jgi:hypothetical protein
VNREIVAACAISMLQIVAILPAKAEDPPPRPKLAVMPLKPLEGVRKGAAEVLTGIITTQVAGLKLFSQVISADEISAVLKAEKMKDALGCSDISCAAEIAGGLGADQMIMGSVGKLGSSIVIQLTLFDNHRVAVIGRAKQSLENNENLFEPAATAALSTLLGVPTRSGSQGGENSAPSEMKFGGASLLVTAPKIAVKGVGGGFALSCPPTAYRRAHRCAAGLRMCICRGEKPLAIDQRSSLLRPRRRDTSCSAWLLLAPS